MQHKLLRVEDLAFERPVGCEWPALPGIGIGLSCLEEGPARGGLSSLGSLKQLELPEDQLGPWGMSPP